MARKTISDIAALLNITLEGNLIAPAMLAKVERLEADGQGEQDYAVKPGLTIRDEIPRAFRIGQALYEQFSGSDITTAGATLRFVAQMLTDVFGFSDLLKGGKRSRQGREYLVHLEAGDGRIPVIVVPPRDTIDRASETLAFDERKRSASTALQDWLNAEDDALWGLATNGEVIRLMRDNASLTRPAFVEADLKQIFETEDYSSFSALWLLLHRTRFGDKPAPVTDCALERWRDTGSKEGAVARDRLRDGVEDALRVFGSGFLEANPDLRKRLSEGDLKLTVFFNELLRIVYSLIFLMVAEDRDLLHDPNAGTDTRQIYAEGYSLKRLRERSIRRSNWDKHRDLYEGLKIVFRSLAQGEEKLGLPALGGLFDQGLIPDLDKSALPNRALMEAIYRLAWLKEKDALLPINWREMETEELGSVYESLLELTPRIDIAAKRFYFAEGDETKGNQRKTTGSYYTPDSLVQVLLDSALDPVLDRIEREADDPADALTKATVIDPACGSGHFLLAAARRIATRVARIRAGGVASATDFRHALRDVARGCIHGVDRNPMAVELTKVALWIETVEPGKPLGFLDANIRCGDALLGVYDLSVLREGIPDAAYKPLTGDDKETAKHFKARNASEKKGQGAFDFAGGSGNLPSAPPFGAFISDFKALPEDTVEEIAAKQAKFNAIQSGPQFWTWRQAADLYITAFLTPKLGGVPDNRNTVTIPTTGHIWQHLNGNNTLYGPLIAGAMDRAAEARVFHWPLEFPDIMQSGGFDVVLGNPPWERIKVQEKEFFASSRPDISSAGTKKARQRLIDQLASSPDGSGDKNLFYEFMNAKREAEATSEFVRVNEGRFPLTGTGDVNTYALFSELFFNLLSRLGHSGMVVPTGIATDDSTKAFFANLTLNRHLQCLYDFENRSYIFPALHTKTKFCLLVLSKSPVKKMKMAFMAREVPEISDPAKTIVLTPSEISKVNPNSHTVPIFRSVKDQEITLKIYENSSAFILRNGQKNPWGATFFSLFHMTSDSGLFERANSNKNLPLYEAKMFWHFDHRWATFTDGKTNLPDDSIKADIHFEALPRFWVSKSEVSNRLTVKKWQKNWLMTFRNISDSRNERTFVAAIIPISGLGNSGSAISIDGTTVQRALALLANLNSIVLDYVAKQKIPGTNVNYFLVEQFPILTPSSYSSEEIDFLNERVVELTYTNTQLTDFASDFGYSGEPFKWDGVRRALLRAELDAFFGRKYGLSKEELEFILEPATVFGEDYPSETFRVLKDNEIERHGEYRTQRLVLEAWDRMEADGTFAQLDLVYGTTTTAPQPRVPTHIKTSRVQDNAWTWPQQDERVRIRTQLRAMVGVLPDGGDAQRLRLATLACLHPQLLSGFLSPDDQAEWLRLVGPQAQQNAAITLTPPTNAAWGAAFNDLVSSAILEISSDGAQWSAGARLDKSTLHAGDPAVGRALFAWAKLQSVDLEQGLSHMSADILPFIREGRLAA